MTDNIVKAYYAIDLELAKVDDWENNQRLRRLSRKNYPGQSVFTRHESGPRGYGSDTISATATGPLFTTSNQSSGK